MDGQTGAIIGLGDFNAVELYKAISRSIDGYTLVINFWDEGYTATIPQSFAEAFQLEGDYKNHFFRHWSEKIHPEDLEKHTSNLEAMRSGKTQMFSMQYRAMDRNGKYVWLESRGFLTRRPDGKEELFTAIIRNMGEQNHLDHVTGLLNKYGFREAVCNNMAEGVESGVLLINIDGFHHINELYSTEFGDNVLRAFGSYVQSRLGDNASVYRLDGDEFGILFANPEENDAQEMYHRISKHYQTHKDLAGKRYHMTISATYYEFYKIEYEELVRSLKIAMRVVKRQGRNSFLPFREEFLQYKERELELLELLRDSVENNFEGFKLNFQPQVYADDKKLKGAEALLRWSCEKYGKVSPDEFIPLLEKSNLIVPVGKWVFEQAVDMCRPWVVFFPEFSMSINVSYLQLFDDSFVDFMKETVEKAGISYQNIIVEVTESKFISDKELLKRMFTSVRSMGMKIAMDDFGTGYSSLGILKEAPADIVKIDKIFVRNIKENSFDSSFIRVVVELCHTVGIKVCLEGVEEDEEMDVVSEMDLDFIQGYLYGKPEEAESFYQMYLSKRGLQNVLNQ